MVGLPETERCCGCGACAAKCPKGAIKMLPSGTLGASEPSVDLQKCLNCGLCTKTCPVVNKNTDEKGFVQLTYAAYSKSDSVRFASSSGGMFLTFARKCIDNGYKVYGAAFDKDNKLKCVRSDSYDELLPLTKSKYLQSDMTGKYGEVEALLKMGENVLFVSTPCHVAALKSYLGKEYENLLTVDFFCHGVPSQKLFDECLEYEDNKHSRKTLEYMFRAKVKKGVTPHYYKIKYEKNGKVIEKTEFYYKSLFYALFQQYITMRDSCYDCIFATDNRMSDITVGDFHDIDKYVSGINRFDGVSTVIINSKKGNELWQSVMAELEVIQMDTDMLKRDGTIFYGGTRKPIGREEFVRDYNEHGLECISKKYFGTGKYWKQEVYYRMPKIIRNILKKLM